MNCMKKAIIITAALALAACGGGAEQQGGRDQKAVEMATRITTMEDSLFRSMAFDQRNAQALLDVYKAYTKTFPQDSLAPEYLFRAAGLASKSMRDPQQGIKLYERVIAEYPAWKRLPDAYYLKAFTIDTELDQKGEAQRAYQEVIDLYPDHPFAADAKRMMEYLQYTDEELIQKFQQQEADAQVAH
jgi:outer membrane protein assembly factor BamD (BamD/ComL family)